MKPNVTLCVSSQKVNVNAMARKETFILFILLSPFIIGCENSSEKNAVSSPTSEPELPVELASSNSSFLDKEREKIDHEAKYQPRFEIDSRWIIFSKFKSPRPTTWIWTTPKSNMRIANYTLEAAAENDVAELSVIQFDKNEGGDLSKNIERWKKHFRSNEGGPVRAIISETIVAGLPTTVVEISGEYMGMGASWHRYNYTMRIALIEFEEGNIFLKLLGPTETISLHQNEWNSFLDSITFIEEN